jgi:hypothetical protein
LTWEVPESSGATAITGYRVEISSNSGSSWSFVSDSTATYAFKEWASGRTYVFRVAASNALGRGEFAESDPFTAQATSAPGVPRSLSATPWVNGAWIQFLPPVNLGDDYPGPAIFYEVQQSEDGGDTWLQAIGQYGSGWDNGIDSAYGGTGLVAQLNPNKTYKFRVRACNSLGCGPYLTGATAISPLLPPTAPTNVKAFNLADGSTYGTYFVDWDPPSFTPALIQGYWVQMKEGNDEWSLVAQVSAPTTQAGGISLLLRSDETLSNNGLQRLFRVLARSAAGDGPYSEPVSLSSASGLNPSAAQYAQSNVQISNSGFATRDITVSWTPPDTSGTGFVLQGYEAALQADFGQDLISRTLSSSTTSTTFTGVSNNEYYFLARAVYTNGQKLPAYYSVSGWITGGIEAPYNLSSSLSGSTVLLSWIWSGLDLVHHMVQYSSDLGATWQTWGTTSNSSSVPITGLATGRGYRFRVVTFAGTLRPGVSNASLPFPHIGSDQIYL